MVQCRRCKRFSFDPWVGTIPWSRKWLPTPVFLPGESQGQRSWWATVHGVTKIGDDWVTEHAHTHAHTHPSLRVTPYTLVYQELHCQVLNASFTLSMSFFGFTSFFPTYSFTTLVLTNCNTFSNIYPKTFCDGSPVCLVLLHCHYIFLYKIPIIDQSNIWILSSSDYCCLSVPAAQAHQL